MNSTNLQVYGRTHALYNIAESSGAAHEKATLLRIKASLFTNKAGALLTNAIKLMTFAS